MKNYGQTTLEAYLGNRVVYRNLVPADPNLPALQTVARQIGLAPGTIPRKTDPDYALVILYLLDQAQTQRGIQHRIERLIYVGDTRLLDGTAFTNLCQAGNLSGLAFIGAENSQPAALEILNQTDAQTLYLANRWSALAEFAAYAAQNDFSVDERTAVVVDIDKTALGARGRNSRVIDGVRVQAVHETVAGLLGPRFDPAAFRTAYDLLNQPEFHPFTADNQDYLAYVCLILGSGLYRLDVLVEQIRQDRLKTIEQFIAAVERQRQVLDPGLAAIHNEIFTNVQAGDPTPFKVFRRREFLTTISRFGCLPISAPIPMLMEQEILITAEVQQAALDWQRQGGLLFGLSDKPDEAAVPTPELAAQGYLSLHLTQTHAVGE